MSDDDDERRALREQDPLGTSAGDIDETALDALLTDYQVATDGGRYRDQFLHYTYYLTLVVLGLVLNFGYDLWQGPATSPLVWTLFAGGAATVFFVLLVWAEGFRHARNACWARQAEIEEYLATVQPGLLRSNESIPNRLTFEYEYRDKSWLERREVARDIKYLLLALVALSILVTVFYFGAWIGSL